MGHRFAAVLLILAAASSSSWAQTPLRAGPEFRANTYTTFNQDYPVVASDASGNFVVVWHGGGKDGGYGVFAQRYDATGAPRGGEFQVNSFTAGGQMFPAVASDARGNVVVVWHSDGQDGSGNGVFAQRHDATGAARGGEFRVNSFTTSGQEFPRVASDASGNFVVVWASVAQDGSADGVFAQRYDASGAPRGVEFRVNTTTANAQQYPSVASDASGNFAVVWESNAQDGDSYGVFAQRYDATGAPRGAEFRVNTVTASLQRFPTVASSASGNLVVAWASEQDGSGFGVFGQRYDDAGVARGAEFRINTYTTAHQQFPIAASDARGNFVVVWDSSDQDEATFGVFGQRYDGDGNPRGSEFRVNSHTTDAQRFPVPASDLVGNVVVGWVSFDQDGSGRGAFGQRFGGLHPQALDVDLVPVGGSDGNDVLEPGETVQVRPGWRNSAGSQQLVGGDGTGFTGPGTATYTIPDAAALYDLPNGGASPCTDCYALAVSSPASRHAVHWDALFLETLVPDEVHGQQQGWTLHVGDSFTDVPRANPFYRFIETLLHHGVTGGCAPGQYCPASSATRREMAVFVLVADEGAGFAPPLCVAGGEAFDDVPAASGFCPWIEELARRGVVNGCNASPPLYCPGDAVTRAQMAVFTLATREPGFVPPACVDGAERFQDVDDTSPFCRWIEELARRGIVSGCSASPPLYCPSAPVTRAQMGVFISGTFGLTLYGP